MSNQNAISQNNSSVIDGKYVVEEPIGCGGHGKVFRALQLSTQRTVALKILDLEQGLAQSAVQRRKNRFRREMKICGQLSHPNVVKLIDYGEHRNSLYLVLELVPGRTLAQHLSVERSLTVAHTVAVMRQLLDVLNDAHIQGIVHRDLKPSNLMIGEGPEHPRLKVLDFGVSAVPKGLSDPALTRLTLSNEMVGTPSYAPPEQMRGDAPAPKNDLYAWGLIMLECLTGSNPMAGTSLAEIYQKQSSPTPVPIPERLRGHPLGTVLRWVLEKNPARRANSSADVLTRLNRIDVSDLTGAGGYYVDQLSRPVTIELDAPLTETAAAVRVEGERRQITALCCRLTLRSTELTETAVLDVCRSDLFGLCRATVEEFGGALVGGFGDLALYSFGMPRAKDTDARMAVRAVLELSARIRSQNVTLTAQRGIGVALKAGIHTGILTLGEHRTGDGLAHSSVATVAIALAQSANGLGEDDAASITVSDEFRYLAARHGEFSENSAVHERSGIELPWSAEPVATYQLTGESLSDVFAEGVAPMVGRDRELEALVDAWRDSRERGRVALIVGEAGIGKSRLAHEFRRVTRDDGHGYLMLRFLPEMQHVALGPVLELVIAELGFKAEQRPSCAGLAMALDGFARVELNSAIPLLCVWMSIPLEAPFAALPFSPQKQRDMLYDALIAIFVELLARRHGYLLVEDLHWADPGTRDWLGRLLRTFKDEGGFALMTARPDFMSACRELAPSWDEVDVLVLELQGLNAEQVSAMVTGLPAKYDIHAHAVEQIVERADGVPLFVEELTRVMGQRNDNMHIGATMSEVPATLRDLMMGRLDALGHTRETAQVAAAIGREFDIDLLTASIDLKNEAVILLDLEELVSAGIVLVQRRIGQQVYLFRHALLRDAAHESLTADGRKSVHDAIATSLLTVFPDRVMSRPALVALHLELAERRLESQAYWLRAGREAIRNLAYSDAVVHLRRGLSVLRHCPAGAERDDAELDLLNAISGAYINWRGTGAAELVPIMARMTKLLEQTSKPRERELPALWVQCGRNMKRPNLDKARRFASQMLRKASALDNTVFVATAHACLSRIEFWMGNHVAAKPHHETCARLHTVELDKQAASITGEPPYIASLCFRTVGRLIEGYADDALAEQRAGLELSRSYEIPQVCMAHKANLAWLHLLRGFTDPESADLEHAHQYGKESSDHAVELGFGQWRIYATMMASAARVMQGSGDEVPTLWRLVQDWEEAGAANHLCWLYGCIAHGLLLQSNLHQVDEVLRAARVHVQRSSEHVFDSQLLRLEAQLLKAHGAPDSQVQDKLLEALAVARRQNAHLFAVYVANALLDLADTPGAIELLRGSSGVERRDVERGLEEVASWWRTTSQGRDIGAVKRLLVRA